MARRIVSLDEKIEKAEAVMLAAKAKYDKALDEMEKLVEKRKKQNDKMTSLHTQWDGYHFFLMENNKCWGGCGEIRTYLRCQRNVR